MKRFASLAHPVSILILTWNSAAYLPRCLASLSQQTYKDFEVIVVDNGSTDGALDGVGSRWPRLTLHVERLVENRGFSAANNLGARLVQGHWLALLNSDAFPDPDWLEKLLQRRSATRNSLFSLPGNFKLTRRICWMAPEMQFTSVVWPGVGTPVSRLLDLDWKPKRCSAHVPRLRCIRAGRSCKWAGLTRIFLVTMRM